MGALAALCVHCAGKGSILVTVEVPGAPLVAVDHLHLIVSSGGQIVTRDSVFAGGPVVMPPPQSFSLVFGPGHTGDFQLTVEAVRVDGDVLGTGTAKGRISANGEAQALHVILDGEEAIADAGVDLSSGDDMAKSPLFGAPLVYTTGGTPFAVALADFNHDHRLDLVVASAGGASVHLGTGDGHFASRIDYPAGRVGSVAVAVGDFNGDGKPDIAITDYLTVAVLLNAGDGTFAAPLGYAPGKNPRSIAVADFDQDGKLDLAVTFQTANQIGLMLGNGDGTFRITPAKSVYPPLNGPISIVALEPSDEVAVANLNEERVSIFSPLGVLDPVQVRLNGPVGPGPIGMDVGDFDGDGLGDLAVAASVTNEVSVLRSVASGGFGPIGPRLPVGARPFSLAVADLDGDGNADIVTANFDGGDVSVLLGNGDATFQLARAFQAGAQPYAVAAGDLDHDGRPDLVVVDQIGTVNVLLNQSGL